MRKLIALAAALLLLPAAASAQVTISRSQTGAVGNIVTCVDQSGASGKCVLPGFVVRDSAGVEKGTAGNPVVNSSASVVSVNLTRPANTTTYTANTALANATSGATYLTFANVCRANGTVVLMPSLRVIDYANQTTKLTGVLWLFSAAPTPINDNATFSIGSADMANLVAQPVAFSVATVANQGAAAAGSAVASVVGTTYEAICGASTSLYGLVQVTNAYVPVSAEQFTFTLQTVGAN